jgi:hypothetical protein
MFPIPSKQLLSLSEVASYWRREIKPTASFDEVFNLLVRAWWRGDLAAEGVKRTDLVRTLYQLHSDRIAFTVPGDTEPPQTRELPDGSGEVMLWWVPLPNSEQDSWDDTNCSQAFNAIADFWDCDFFPDIEPIVCGLNVTEREFTRWIGSQESYESPIFWAHGDQEKAPSAPKQLSARRANDLAADYFRSAREAGREPTQSGFENKMREAHLAGRGSAPPVSNNALDRKLPVVPIAERD